MIARLLALALVCGGGPALAEPFTDAARGATPILDATHPPRLTNWVNDDQRRPRNYDMQPPTIPHRVDGYQVDRSFNKCLDCHARTKTDFSQATPVSPTHYIDRKGKVLPTISTRRYFCQQCHVAQEPVKPLVDNTFQDVDTVVRNGNARAPAAPSTPKK
ncbi:MAG: nitrate reductase cytochrome c-type subunit [Rhizobacter sp.]